MPDVLPSVQSQAFTDADRGDQGRWQTFAMVPVTGDAQTTLVSKYSVVDDQGRPGVLYVSAARTVTPTAQTLYSRGALGLSVYISATAVTATPSIVVTIDGYDAGSATWYNILTSAAIATVSTKRMIVHPTVAAVANLSVATAIPDTIRVVMTHGDTDSITYSVTLDWMP